MLDDSVYLLRDYMLMPLLRSVDNAEQLYNESEIWSRGCVESGI